GDHAVAERQHAVVGDAAAALEQGNGTSRVADDAAVLDREIREVEDPAAFPTGWRGASRDRHASDGYRNGCGYERRDHPVEATSIDDRLPGALDRELACDVEVAGRRRVLAGTGDRQ